MRADATRPESSRTPSWRRWRSDGTSWWCHGGIRALRPPAGCASWRRGVRGPGAEGGGRYGDGVGDTTKGTAVFEEWLTKTRPGPGPDGTRRPMWLARPVKPTPDAYRF